MKLWTPPRKMITPTCQRCGRFRREYLAANRRRMGIGGLILAVCCCATPVVCDGRCSASVGVNLSGVNPCGCVLSSSGAGANFFVTSGLVLDGDYEVAFVNCVESVLDSVPVLRCNYQSTLPLEGQILQYNPLGSPSTWTCDDDGFLLQTGVIEDVTIGVTIYKALSDLSVVKTDVDFSGDYNADGTEYFDGLKYFHGTSASLTVSNGLALDTATRAITAVNTTSDRVTVSGDQRGLFPIGGTAIIQGSTGNNGTYVVEGRFVSAGTTIITLDGLPSAVADGVIFGRADSCWDAVGHAGYTGDLGPYQYGIASTTGTATVEQ